MNELTILLAAAPTFAILGLGFLLGLKHATEADHLAAVSTMVSERRSIWSSALVGGLWGFGRSSNRPEIYQTFTAAGYGVSRAGV